MTRIDLNLKMSTSKVIVSYIYILTYCIEYIKNDKLED